MIKRRKKRQAPEVYIEGIRAGNRVWLSQAITLVESHLDSDQLLAQEVLQALLPYTGHSIRLGITGVPGVGKSTFIEALGNHITQKGQKLAVLAIDPSSPKSGGSIMGDKTRMTLLSQDPRAYIRPSPTHTSLGGVARKTRESMLLCEAAGFEIIIVETVGVGQSETLVKNMVDFFLLLMLAGAGDELQGIKKGIMEMADAIAINKADGDNLQAARVAQNEYKSALRLFPPNENGWFPPVLTCSSTEKSGIPEIWEMVLHYHKEMREKGFIQKNRQSQNQHWLFAEIRNRLESDFFQHPKVKEALVSIEPAIQNGSLSVYQAVQKLMDLFLKR